MGSKRSIHILTKILIKFIEVGLETLFFGNGRGSFGRIEQAGQKGPPLLGKVGALFPENFHPDGSVSFIFRLKF